MISAAVRLQTEQLNTTSIGIDVQPSIEALHELIACQIAAAKSVEHSIPEIGAASVKLTETLSLIYKMAWTSFPALMRLGRVKKRKQQIENENEILRNATDLFQTGEFCCMIIEPLVQGASGMRMYSAKFLDQLTLQIKIRTIIGF